MKSPKLKLDELKVQSFVTQFDKAEDQTREVNGGLIAYQAKSQCGSHHVCCTKDILCPTRFACDLYAV
jgi:hypothetical protein